MNDLVETTSSHSDVTASQRTSLGDALDGAGARRNAFETIRLMAAMSVILPHSFP